MILSVEHILDLIAELPKGQEFEYVKPGKNKAKLISIDKDRKRIEMSRVNSNTKDTDNSSLTEDNLQTIVNSVVENIPFSIDKIFNNGGNTRSVWEAIIANTSEFYKCMVGKNKNLVWIPTRKKQIGVITEIAISDIPNSDKNEKLATASIKEDFRYFLSECVKSTRTSNNVFGTYGDNAVQYYLSMFDKNDDGNIVLFDYNPSKWSYIQDIYKVDDPKKAEKIFIDLLNDPDFIRRDKEDNNGWRPGALNLYILFLRARKRFSKVISMDRVENPGTNNSQPFQQIFYGAPGTGKSHTIKEQTEDKSVIRTTFHPDSDYSTFVGCYKPSPIDVQCYGVNSLGNTVKMIDLVQDGEPPLKEQRITYKFIPQAFLKAYLGAWKKYTDAQDGKVEPQFLIIEEINRGNCAQIFGDLFQLLDRADNGFSEYPIEADTDLQKEIANAFSSDKDYQLQHDINVEGVVEKYKSNYGKTLSKDIQSGRVLLLPSNLYIWATMNTSDQSLFPIDSAFKRRWNWVYMPIDTAKENWSIRIGNSDYSWTAFLNKVNNELLTDETAEDKHLGFYFCKPSLKKNESDEKPTIITQEVFVAKVLFYLWTDVFKVYGIPSAIGSSKDWAFAKFYNANGSVNVLKVIELMNKLNIGSPSEDEAIDVEVIENSAEAQNSDKNYLKEIRFPDGVVLEKSGSAFDTYIKAIEKIGVDRIATVADKVKFHRKNRPLISTEKYPELDNNDGFSYHQIGNYYFVKGPKTLTYVNILEKLNSLLNVGMDIICGK